MADAAALGAEVKAQGVTANVGRSFSRNFDIFALVAVCPKHSISSTCRAVACRRRRRKFMQFPVSRSAMARTFNHMSAKSEVQENKSVL